MSKYFTNLQIINSRWRGIMPFRQRDDSGRKQLDLQRRTGEPSLAFWPPFTDDPGYGKALGSYTEKFRLALWDWMEENLGSWLSPLTFKYKLYRHKIVTVTGEMPYIKHIPSYGSGKKGFILSLNVLSIDGVRYRRISKVVSFAMDRIISNEKVLQLKNYEMPTLL